MDKLNIRQFKLQNGEEIIALVSQKSDDSFIVERPFLIKSNVVGGYMFLPWFPFSSQRIFKIANENIMHHVELDEGIKTEYIKMAAELNMKPRLKLDRSLIEELTEFLNEHSEEIEEIDMMDELEQYEDNVIPFQNPKDTIH